MTNGAGAGGIVCRRVDADLDLVGGETAGFFLFGIAQIAVEIAAADDGQQRHLAAPFVAQQRMHRFVGSAAGEIVKRDLDRGLGTVISVHAAIHRNDRTGDVRGRAASQRGLEIVHGGYDALERIAGHHRRGCGLAPADQAAVGFDPHQHVVGAPHFLARHDDGLDHRKADRDRLDRLDVHGRC